MPETNNKKVFTYLLLGFFFLTLVAAAYFSYVLWLKPKLKTGNQIDNVVITPIVNQPGDTIIKSMAIDKNEVYYEVEGSFVNGLEKYGTGILLRGGFIIKGDSFKTEIPVIMGEIFGTIYYRCI